MRAYSQRVGNAGRQARRASTEAASPGRPRQASPTPHSSHPRPTVVWGVGTTPHTPHTPPPQCVPWLGKRVGEQPHQSSADPEGRHPVGEGRQPAADPHDPTRSTGSAAAHCRPPQSTCRSLHHVPPSGQARPTAHTGLATPVPPAERLGVPKGQPWWVSTPCVARTGLRTAARLSYAGRPGGSRATTAVMGLWSGRRYTGRLSVGLPSAPAQSAPVQGSRQGAVLPRRHGCRESASRHDRGVPTTPRAVARGWRHSGPAPCVVRVRREAVKATRAGNPPPGGEAAPSPPAAVAVKETVGDRPRSQPEVVSVASRPHAPGAPRCSRWPPSLFFFLFLARCALFLMFFFFFFFSLPHLRPCAREVDALQSLGCADSDGRSPPQQRAASGERRERTAAKKRSAGGRGGGRCPSGRPR